MLSRCKTPFTACRPDQMESLDAPSSLGPGDFRLTIYSNFPLSNIPLLRCQDPRRSSLSSGTISSATARPRFPGSWSRRLPPCPWVLHLNTHPDRPTRRLLHQCQCRPSLRAAIGISAHRNVEIAGQPVTFHHRRRRGRRWSIGDGYSFGNNGRIRSKPPPAFATRSSSRYLENS